MSVRLKWNQINHINPVRKYQTIKDIKISLHFFDTNEYWYCFSFLLHSINWIGLFEFHKCYPHRIWSIIMPLYFFRKIVYNLNDVSKPKHDDVSFVWVSNTQNLIFNKCLVKITEFFRQTKMLSFMRCNWVLLL